MRISLILLVVTVPLVAPFGVSAQESDPATDLIVRSLKRYAVDMGDSEVFNLFIDCNVCDNTLMRREIDFVNHVLERRESDVHLLITRERSGAGYAHFLNFIGLNRFTGLVDTLLYESSNTDTDAEVQNGLVRMVKLGLARYVARTTLANELNLSRPRRIAPRLVDPSNDPWKSWVFRVNMYGSFDGQESKSFFKIDSNINADRVTDDWKIRFRFSGTYRRNQFDVTGDDPIVSTRRTGYLTQQVVRSIGERWSLGAFSTANTSSLDNTDLELKFIPAIEYTIFPYSESSRRELRLSYRLGIRHFDYTDVTIFGSTTQDVLHHELGLSLEFTQPWGNAAMEWEASSYLSDFSEDLTDLYRIELYGYLDVRLVRGFSVTLEGFASRVRDQIFLPLEEASSEDILLGNVSLPTDYEYLLAIGFTYRFGSIYNNIVNSRFGV